MTDTPSPSAAKRGTTARSRSRQRAVEILFEAEARGSSVLEGIRTRRESTDLQVNEYTQRLVEGVIADQERLDEALTSYSRGWPLDRMPAVDRAILRMATYELLWADDVPDAVVIDEAVELAKTLSTDDSPAYVNGVLGAILAAEVPTSS